MNFLPDFPNSRSSISIEGILSIYVTFEFAINLRFSDFFSNGE